MTASVLVVVAHADDETLGAGGAIIRHVLAGNDVRVVIAADCRAARSPAAGAPPTVPQLLPAAEAACLTLGVGAPPLFLGFPALGIPERALTQAVDDVVRTLQPTIVYTHHWGDLNADHRAVAQAVAVATRPGGSVRRVLCCEIPSSTEWAPNGDFRPSYFVDTSAMLSRKLRAMAHYASELRPAPHPRNLAALRARARYWGQVAGVLFAEPFVLVREVL
jgi:LmbE family N-acetylglucosaminyl deacetylase